MKTFNVKTVLGKFVVEADRFELVNGAKGDHLVFYVLGLLGSKAVAFFNAPLVVLEAGQ